MILFVNDNPGVLFLLPASTVVIQPGPLFGKITDISSLKGNIKGTSGLNGAIRWINS